MAKQSLLLVDGDARSLRVLEVSLKKAGFNVTTAVNGRDALDKVHTAAPDLIISDTDMPEMDGFAFCEELKNHEQWAEIPFIFLTKESSIENKIRGLELGVEDYLTKPIYIKEILTRIRILLQKHQRATLEGKRDNRTRFSGRISDLGVVDLIQTIEMSRKSGLIQVNAGEDRRAVVYFRDGKVIDAEAGSLQGEDAVYRVLTWSDGEFEVFFRNVRRKDVIPITSQALLMEGMRRLDEWGRLLEQLPSLETAFVIDTAELAERLADLPDELNAILKLFDGRRNLMEIIDASDYGDLECLEAIAKLYFEGLITDETPADAVPSATIEEDSGMFALRVSRLTTAVGMRMPGRVPQERAESASHDRRASTEDIEHTISGEELDLADVAVAAKPQTSLVEVAIGAATPIIPTPIAATPEPSQSDESPRRASRQSDLIGTAPRQEPPVYEDKNVPEAVPNSSSAPIHVVSSQGAEVATASGEFSISEIEARGLIPAREIVTIKPRRDTQDGIKTRDPKETPEQLPSAKRRARQQSTADPTTAPASGTVPETTADGAPAAESALGDAPESDVDIPIDTDLEPATDDSAEPAEDRRRTDGSPSEPEPPRLAVGPLPELDDSPLRKNRWLLIGFGLAAIVVLVVVLTRGGNRSSSSGASSATLDAGSTRQSDAHVAIQTPADAALPDAATADAAPNDDASDVVDADIDVAQDSPPKTYREFYKEAKRARARKDFARAVEMIDKTIELRRSARYITYKAEILSESGDFQAALASIDQAIKVSPRYPNAWLRKGEYHLSLNQNSDAIKAFQHYLELEPHGEMSQEVRATLKDIK